MVDVADWEGAVMIAEIGQLHILLMLHRLQTCYRLRPFCAVYCRAINPKEY
jgi:hypothetical protein